MSTGKDFVVTVRPVSRSAQGAAGGASSRGSRRSSDSGPQLTILFRPADSAALRPGMPHIGIPAWVGAAAAEAGSTEAAPSPFAALAREPYELAGEGGAQQGAAGTAYFFGIVQEAGAPQPSGAASAGVPSPTLPASSSNTSLDKAGRAEAVSRRRAAAGRLYTCLPAFT